MQNVSPSEGRRFLACWPQLFRATARNVVRREKPTSERVIDFEGVESEIDRVFQRKLMALRRLPRAARPHALRAARDERMLALKALRERRASARRARWVIRKTVPQIPIPT